MQDYGLNLTIKVRRSQLLSPKPSTVPLWTQLGKTRAQGEKRITKKIKKKKTTHISAKRLSIDSLLSVFTKLGNRTLDTQTCIPAQQPQNKLQNNIYKVRMSVLTLTIIPLNARTLSFTYSYSEYNSQIYKSL